MNSLNEIKAIEHLVEESKKLYLLWSENKKEIEDLRFLCHEAAEYIHQMGVHGADKPDDCPDCQLAGRLKAAAQGVK